MHQRLTNTSFIKLHPIFDESFTMRKMLDIHESNVGLDFCQIFKSCINYLETVLPWITIVTMYGGQRPSSKQGLFSHKRCRVGCSAIPSSQMEKIPSYTKAHFTYRKLFSGTSSTLTYQKNFYWLPIIISKISYSSVIEVIEYI